MPERRSAPISPVVAKTSAGASEHVPIARVTNITRALEQMKKANIWVIGLDERGTPDYTAFDFNRDCVLVLGAEGSGLHDLVKKNVRLPAQDSHGRQCHLPERPPLPARVVMYEALRQRTSLAIPPPTTTPVKPHRGLGS